MYALAARLARPGEIQIEPGHFLHVVEEELRSESPYYPDSTWFEFNQSERR